MKALFCGLLFSTSLFASELSPRVYEVLGSYDSQEARNSDSYIAHDLSSFNILITPDYRSIVHFDEWDIEMKLDKDLNFYQSDISECEDPGCSGVGEIEGKIFFKQLNGKDVPYAKVTMYFYADTSEDVDCDVVNCDDLDYDDYFKTWEETFEFNFSGSFDGQVPTFNPAPIDSELAKNLYECTSLTGGTFIRCASATSYQFKTDIDAAELKKLSDFAGVTLKQTVAKEVAVAVLRSQVQNALLQTKVYTFNSVETEAYKALEKNLNELVAIMEKTAADTVYTNMSRYSGYRHQAGVEFILVDSASRQVRLLNFSL